MAAYTIEDSAGTFLMEVRAEAPIKALDAYAHREGFAPYSELLARPDLYGEGWVYELPDGALGAIFCNYEIRARETVS